MDPKELLKKLSDHKWRLNNLYYITDKNGQQVKFRMNVSQEAFFDNLHYKNIILKARQLGFSTFLQIYMLDLALFFPNTSCGVIAHTLKDAQTLFRTKVRYAYDNLPEAIKKTVQIVQCNSTELVLSNGSTILVGTSLRGGTYQVLHISEFGKIAARFPDRADEIVSGALNTQPPGGFAFIESTAEGQEGLFYEFVQTARSKENMKEDLTEMDWKFHFYPWWQEPSYVLDAKSSFTPEVDKYFDQLKTQGIKLNAKQKQWYAKKVEEQKDKMTREFPSTPDEAFAAAIEGAYYGELLAKAERDGRIGTVPYDPRLEVETTWDIGMSDSTTIWFRQIGPNGEFRYIDYYENSGEGLSHYARVLKEKAIDNDWRYSRHIGPHDSEVREWTRDGKTRREVAEELGLRPWVVTGRLSLNEGIDQVRSILPRCYIDATKCQQGLTALKAYRKDWNDKLGTWHNRPRHDNSSHAADAFRTGATAPNITPNHFMGPDIIIAPNFGAV